MITIKPFSEWSGWAWVSGIVALALLVVGAFRFTEGAVTWAMLDFALAVLNGFFFYQDVKVDNKSDGFNS